MKKSVVIRIICVIVLLSVMCIIPNNSEAQRFNMSYLYGNFNYTKLVASTNKSLNEVSPSYFDLTTHGDLLLRSIDISFVEEMHRQGIKVIPFLSNHWDRSTGRYALGNIDTLTTQIANAIREYNLDGVNVDIENVTDVDKENYTNLVKTLREKLPKDKSVSVAVAANPNGWTTGWHGSYDYEKLAMYADYLMIMAYDEHYESGEAGPVASISFVENSIKYALTKTTKDKIVIGIPFYGRYWQDGNTYGGYGVSLTKINSIINKYSSTVTYDEASKSAKVSVRIKASDEKPVINGRTLSAGTYTFWYENEKSIKAKLALVNKYDLKGTGSWSLGQELPNTWNYYKDSLNEGVVEFDDVKETDWFYEAVKNSKESGLIKGKSEKIYAPYDGLTRAEFSVMLSRMLKIEIIENKSYSYNDVENSWAKDYIEAVTKAGYMQGQGDDIFSPNSFITREEVAKVISDLNLNISESTINYEYIDLNPYSWSYKYIVDVTKKGILKGYPGQIFMPQRIITRAEIAQILTRII